MLETKWNSTVSKQVIQEPPRYKKYFLRISLSYPLYLCFIDKIFFRRIFTWTSFYIKARRSWHLGPNSAEESPEKFIQAWMPYLLKNTARQLLFVIELEYQLYLAQIEDIYHQYWICAQPLDKVILIFARSYGPSKEGSCGDDGGAIVRFWTNSFFDLNSIAMTVKQLHLGISPME